MIAMQRFVLLLALASSLFAVRPGPAFACSCIAPGPPAAERARSTAVFAGQVTDIEVPLCSLTWSSADPVKVKFQVFVPAPEDPDLAGDSGLPAGMSPCGIGIGVLVAAAVMFRRQMAPLRNFKPDLKNGLILLIGALALLLTGCAPPQTPAGVPPSPSDTPPPQSTSQSTAPLSIQVIEEEIVERVETDQGVELRRTVRVYRVTPVPPLEELVKIGNVEADAQIEIVRVEITPGVGPPGGCRPPAPCPPRMSFMVVAISRNHGPVATIRTQITIEDPLTGETRTTHVDELVDGGAMTGPRLGFIVEPKHWIAHVEVRVVP